MRTKGFLRALTIGALVGSALGLFFSPSTGKKNREKFKKVTKKVSEKLIFDLSKVKKVSRKEYDKVVENIIKKYSKDDLMEPLVWLEIKKELKARYSEISAEIKKHQAEEKARKAVLVKASKAKKKKTKK